MRQRIWAHCVLKCCKQIGGSLLLPGLAVYFTLQDQHSSWIFMIVPPNVRTQRRLFLPDRERRGWEERGDSMPESRSIFSSTAYEGKSALCSARPSLRSTTMDWRKRVAREERQRARRRERERREREGWERNAALFMKHARIFRTFIFVERNASSDHNAFEQRRAAIAGWVGTSGYSSGQDTLGIIVTLFCNWWMPFLALFLTRNM